VAACAAPPASSTQAAISRTRVVTSGGFLLGRWSLPGSIRIPRRKPTVLFAISAPYGGELRDYRIEQAPSPRRACPKLRGAPAVGVAQPDDEGGARGELRHPLRPLDQQQTVVEVAPAEELELLGAPQPVQVHVVDGAPADLVRLDQGIGGARNGSIVPQRADEPARERGLAGAQLPLEQDRP